MDFALLACCIAFVVGLFAFGWGFRIWRRHRLIRDTPTARARSMPMGRVELFGSAQDKAELLAPLSQNPCVYYRYRIEQVQHSGNHTRWETVDSGDSSAWGFYLEDETGRILVMPEDAEIKLRRDFRFTSENIPLWIRQSTHPQLNLRHLRSSSWWSDGGRLRFSEWRLEAGDPVYVLGVAQPRPGIAAERRERILEKLRALKSDPDAMAHLDSDGDGVISAQEWEVARNLTVEEVSREPVADRVAVAVDPAGRAPFLISDRDEQELLDAYRWQAPSAIFGGAALAVAGLIYGLHYLSQLGE